MTAPVVVNPQPLLNALAAAVAVQGLAYAVGKKPAVSAGLPWVVGWPNAGSVQNRTMRSRDGWAATFSFQCFGLTTDAAMIAVRKLRAAVLGLHLTVVDGHVVHVLSQDDYSPPPMQRDDDVDPPLFMQYDEWRIRLTPA